MDTLSTPRSVKIESIIKNALGETDLTVGLNTLQPFKNSKSKIEDLRKSLLQAVEPVEESNNIAEAALDLAKKGDKIPDEMFVYFAVHQLDREFREVCFSVKGKLFISETALKAIILLDADKIICAIYEIELHSWMKKCKYFTRQLLVSEECTLMHYVIKSRAYKCFDYLLKYFHPANEIVDMSGRTIAHYAAMSHDMHFYHSLDHLPKDVADSNGNTVKDVVVQWLSDELSKIPPKKNNPIKNIKNEINNIHSLLS